MRLKNWVYTAIYSLGKEVFCMRLQAVCKHHIFFPLDFVKEAELMAALCLLNLM